MNRPHVSVSDEVLRMAADEMRMAADDVGAPYLPSWYGATLVTTARRADGCACNVYECRGLDCGTVFIAYAADCTMLCRWTLDEALTALRELGWEVAEEAA